MSDSSDDEYGVASLRKRPGKSRSLGIFPRNNRRKKTRGFQPRGGSRPIPDIRHEEARGLIPRARTNFRGGKMTSGSLGSPFILGSSPMRSLDPSMGLGGQIIRDAAEARRFVDLQFGLPNPPASSMRYGVSTKRKGKRKSPKRKSKSPKRKTKTKSKSKSPKRKAGRFVKNPKTGRHIKVKPGETNAQAIARVNKASRKRSASAKKRLSPAQRGAKKRTSSETKRQATRRIGRIGKSKTRLPSPSRGVLSKHGYTTKKAAGDRRKAVSRAAVAEANKFGSFENKQDAIKGMNKIVSALSLRSQFFKNKDPVVYRKMQSDMKWLQKQVKSLKKERTPARKVRFRL